MTAMPKVTLKRYRWSRKKVETLFTWQNAMHSATEPPPRRGQELQSATSACTAPDASASRSRGLRHAA